MVKDLVKKETEEGKRWKGLKRTFRSTQIAKQGLDHGGYCRMF